MQKIIDSASAALMSLPNWAKQLANLTRVAWSGDNGKCYFPYMPLTTADFWQESVAKEWLNKSMYSWVMTNSDDRIISHVALVNKGDFWEFGRWVAFPSAPKGITTTLCQAVMEFIRIKKLQIRVECTQTHTRSQAICEKIGLRFAGIGILKKVDNIWWDIIFFDNADLPDFYGQPGIIANPLGNDVLNNISASERLRMIANIISTEVGGTLPPKKFHILPRLEQTVRKIISLNT